MCVYICIYVYIYIYIYIYICQQHGGLLGGNRSHSYILLNFVSLLLFSSVKKLLAIRSCFESLLQSLK